MNATESRTSRAWSASFDEYPLLDVIRAPGRVHILPPLPPEEAASCWAPPVQHTSLGSILQLACCGPHCNEIQSQYLDIAHMKDLRWLRIRIGTGPMHEI